MKHFLTIILIAFTLTLSAQNYKQHKIKAGETIESIAKQYLVTPFDIYALNPDAKADFKIDMVLIIPNSRVKNEPLEEDKRELIGYRKHKVKRKETLFSLSKKYSVTIEEIKKANRRLYSENLKKGDRIKIPKYRTTIYKQSLNNTIKKYTVKPKEGKWRIAYKFGITVAELEDLNPNMNEVIQPGDELNVPNIADNEEKVVEPIYNYYEVLPKEGFYRLKIKLGLTQEQLETLNPELKYSGLKEGMVLKVPADVDAVSAMTSVEVTDLGADLTNFETKKIALMMPYRLNKIDVDSVKEAKSKIKNNRLLSVVLDFHSGVLMALDSAKQLGISTHLNVFDTRNHIATVGQLLEQNDFSDYDAVIGPVKEDCFDRVATALKRDSVPVIAAMTKPNKVHSNVFQTIPKDKLLQKTMIDFVKRDSLKSKVVIISDEQNRIVSEMLKKEFPEAKLIFSQKDKKDKTKDAYFIYPNSLQNIFPVGKKTIVFLNTNNNAFVSSVISMLNGFLTKKTKIVLTTLNKTKAFEGKNIDNNHLSNLEFHYPSVNKDYDDRISNSFIKAYKKEYGVAPNKFASRGYDITLDILLRLASNEDLYKASNNAIETQYIENKFRYNKSLFGGYINEAVYIVKYDDLKIVEAN